MSDPIAVIDTSDGRVLNTMDDNDWRRVWSCGCRIYTGWWADDGAAGSIFTSHTEHEPVMRRAAERAQALIRSRDAAAPGDSALGLFVSIFEGMLRPT